MLSIKSLTVAHGNTTLLEPISFEIAAGQALIIMGETGAGKSLIAQAVLGAMPEALTVSGEIHLNGKRIDTLSRDNREQLWGTSIASLPQEPWRALSPLVRSYDQVYEVHRMVAERDANSAHKHTEKNFQTLNLEGAHSKRPFQLSGGMGQRVAFAAALAGGAPVLLADEPTKGLDERRKTSVVDALKEIPSRRGALVVITHEVSVAKSIGGKIMVLKEGVLVEAGDTLSVLNNPSHEYTNELLQADPSHWQAASVTRSDRPVLELNQLVAGRNGVALTKPLDLSITEGRRMAITGPSGKGKSTLLDTIADIIAPISGSIDRPASLRTTDIQKIYQDPPAAFAPSVSLKNSLNDVAKLHRISWQTIERYLSRLSVSLDLLERRPSAVSGGELQRVAIARALIVKPKLILADEPTSRLDPVTQRLTMDLLAEVANENNAAVLLVTHDRKLAENWTEEIVSL